MLTVTQRVYCKPQVDNDGKIVWAIWGVLILCNTPLPPTGPLFNLLQQKAPDSSRRKTQDLSKITETMVL